MNRLIEAVESRRLCAVTASDFGGMAVIAGSPWSDSTVVIVKDGRINDLGEPEYIVNVDGNDIMNAVYPTEPLYTVSVMIGLHESNDTLTLKIEVSPPPAGSNPDAVPHIEVQMGPGSDTFHGSSLLGVGGATVISTDNPNGEADNTHLGFIDDTYSFDRGNWYVDDDRGHDTYKVDWLSQNVHSVHISDQNGNNSLFVRGGPTDFTSLTGEFLNGAIRNTDWGDPDGYKYFGDTVIHLVTSGW